MLTRRSTTAQPALCQQCVTMMLDSELISRISQAGGRSAGERDTLEEMLRGRRAAELAAVGK